uniref:Uncharacterized protein n=1 Tax=Gasterosteus aculeatus aculeatus TaxID=481459 RepID=A0AAQ4PUL8_GASAC
VFELQLHHCSSGSPSRHPACIPSPCRGSGHLGMQKRAGHISPAPPMSCWQKP